MLIKIPPQFNKREDDECTMKSTEVETCKKRQKTEIYSSTIYAESTRVAAGQCYVRANAKHHE